MTEIYNIGVITFSPLKRIVEKESGYKVQNILSYNKNNGTAHSSWLCGSVCQKLSTQFLYKKNTDRQFLFITWGTSEFSFNEEDLDEVLAWLNIEVFNQDEC